MTIPFTARNGYRDAVQTIKTDRSTEYEAFAKITRHLRDAGTKPKDMSQLAKALHDNRKLWSLLACDVADHNNPLPETLRARILYLAEFTRRHTQAVLRSKAPVESLIEINTAIMAGLRNQRHTS